jgi:hypothetical protein
MVQAKQEANGCNDAVACIKNLIQKEIAVLAHKGYRSGALRSGLL